MIKSNNKAKKTKRKVISQATLARVKRLLLSKNMNAPKGKKLTYRQIAERCKVSAPAVGRIASTI